VLRGVAIFAVLIGHLPFSSSTAPGGPQVSVFPEWVTDITIFGKLGVDLFIVLSGFCIHQAQARAAPGVGPNFLQFWKRRLIRLYPPYLGALLITLAGLVVYYSMVGGARGFPAVIGYTDGNQAALDLFLLLVMAQNLNGASHRVGNGPFWSLALEEQLYLLYFGLLAMLRRMSWPKVLLATFFVTLTWRIVGLAYAPALPSGWQFLGPSRWFEWTLGALAVESFVGKVRLPPWCRSLRLSVLLLVAGISFTVFRRSLWEPLGLLATALDTSLYGVSFFLLVNRCVYAERTSGLFAFAVFKPLYALGQCSYSVYLIHSPIIVMSKLFVMKLGGGIAVVLFARLFFAIASGVVYYRVVERYFNNLSKRATGTRGTQLSKTSASIPSRDRSRSSEPRHKLRGR
jgi:peptidoglycan/LPS O-acetylase OafA/YrhL